MIKAHILVVDDEADIREIVKYNLAREGYSVACAENAQRAREEIRLHPPDILILDLMLPGDMDGLELCRKLKSSPDTAQIPVIMLTARTEEADVVSGLELGADDYVTKPFSPRVLSARVRAVLRRKQGEKSDTLAFDELVIHTERHSATIQGHPVELTATEFGILALLARRPGWVFSRERIVDATRSASADVTSRSVDVHIVSLRRKLGELGRCIETVRGVGYRFRDPRDE